MAIQVYFYKYLICLFSIRCVCVCVHGCVNADGVVLGLLVDDDLYHNKYFIKETILKQGTCLH